MISLIFFIINGANVYRVATNNYYMIIIVDNWELLSSRYKLNEKTIYRTTIDIDYYNQDNQKREHLSQPDRE